MDAQGLELFDTPVDYVVTYEGDYYQDPSIPDSLPTWQYAVVPTNFVFPAGIIYEILAQIHIPGDSYTAIETEAERLASLQDSLNGGGSAPSGKSGGIQPNSASDCDPCFVWDPILRQCVPQGQGCGTNPPPPAVDAAVPAGNIYVHDTNLPTFPGTGSDLAVRKARVVARRWFKIERVFTDNAGHFQFTKRFKHKVRILVKFKNADAEIKNIRGARFWQMLFAVKRTLGIFSGNKSAIPPFIFTQSQDYGSKGNTYWTAATVHNAVQDYRGYVVQPQEQMALPPQGLKIFIGQSATFGRGGATPMYAKRVINNISTYFGLTYLSSITAFVAPIIAVVKSQLDMIIGYRYENGNHQRDITLLLSDKVKEITYHELTHAAHYAALGNSWYSSFITAEEAEIVSNFNSGFSPYGDGTNSSSPTVALGESWAYYMGHYLADKTYGASASCQSEQDNIQGTIWCNTTGTGHPHLDVEENFNPNLAADRFEWIPQGLFRDLNDNTNEQKATGGFVNDNVLGFTNQQMFNAFQNTIYTLQDYRFKLVQLNPNNQTTQVTSLFADYHY